MGLLANLESPLERHGRFVELAPVEKNCTGALVQCLQDSDPFGRNLENDPLMELCGGEPTCY